MAARASATANPSNNQTSADNRKGMSDTNHEPAPRLCANCGHTIKQPGLPCVSCGEPTNFVPGVAGIPFTSPLAAPIVATRAIIATLIRRTENERSAAANAPETERKTLSAFEHFARVVSLLRELDRLIVQMEPPLAARIERLESDLSGLDAIRDVLAERERQDAKWGEQNVDPFHFLAFVGEEFGEYCEATVQTVYGGPKGGFANMRKEAVHLAAVALSALQSFDRHKWLFGTDPDRNPSAHRMALEEKRAMFAESDAAAMADGLAYVIGSTDPAHLRRMRAEISLRPPTEDGGRQAGYLSAIESLIRYQERMATARVESNDNADAA